MKIILCILVILAALPSATARTTVPDKGEVRSGNRDFRKKRFKDAEIDYRRALVKDSTSVIGNYNLANTLYRMGESQDASKYIETAENGGADADIFFNKGDIALQNKDYNTAVEAFRQSLLLNPSDIDAKENYIYAKKLLDEQNQQQQQDQNQDRNQDQNQDQDQQQNRDKNREQDKEQEQNQSPQPQEQPRMSPQTAEQMLQAIEAKEKETQDKVKKEQALRAGTRKKDKNW